MKVIDAHIHFSNIEIFKETAKKKSNVDYSRIGLNQEFSNSNIIAGIGMGLTETNAGRFPDRESQNPMLLDLDELPKDLYECIGINPYELINNKIFELRNLEQSISSERVVGIKIYAGYYHYHVWDEVYDDVYKLAEKYKLPVVIHSGDTYSEKGLLKYSHPLEIDELAMKYRNVNFIVAHFGDPWIMETAELISKNSNVYADLSGLIVGNKQVVKKFSEEPLFKDHIKRGLIYANNYKKILFGSDWPLVRIETYIEFIKELIPKEHWDDVFYKNALKLFKNIKMD
ncbi:amidohydrolase family protein [Mycoplasmatota bacterium]|nr:amidohydrolase family protein [Mycoplasmatota bacterium]